MGAAVQAGEAGRRAQAARLRARHGHDGLLPSRPDHLPANRVRAVGHPRAPGGGQLPAQGAEGRLRRPVERAQGDVRARRGARRVPAEGRGRPQPQAGARRAVRAGQGERPPGGTGAAVDRGDRRAREELRERHPDGLGRHARERPAGGARQGGPQLHRDAHPLAEGRHDHRRGHPRRAGRHPERVHGGAAVPGADQGSAEQPRGAVGGRLDGPPGARAVDEREPQRRGGDRRPDHPRRPGARGEPRRAAGGHPQERDVAPADAAGQAERLHARPRAPTARSSSSRATRPADRPSRGATARDRRSCRCAARC